MFTPSPALWVPQRRGLEETIGLLEAGQSVCLYGPTGSGKTTVAFELFRYAQSLGVGASFYVNRRLLVRQTADRFRSGGLRVGVRAAEYDDEFDPGAQFQICSADTERARVFERGIWAHHDAGLIVVDEAHLNRTQVMREIIDYHKARGSMIVGLSATPIGLSEWYDDIVISGKLAEYRDCNALVPAKVFSPQGPDLRKIKRNKTGEFILDGQKKQIFTQAIVGNVIADWKERNPDARPTILFAPGKPESVWLTEQFQKEGVNWCHVDATEAVVDGKRYSLTRDLWSDIIARTNSGEIKGISSRFKCLDSQTEILTRRGWVGRDEFQESDIVATLNTGDFSVAWEPIKKVLRRDLQPGESMYALRAKHLDVRVTGNHEMVFKSKCRKTKKWAKRPAELLAEKRGSYEIPVSGVFAAPGLGLSEHQLSFLGWFLSDGHARKGDVSICQSTTQPCYLHNSIEQALDGCGFDWTQAMYGDGVGVARFVRYTVNKRKNPGYLGLERFLDKEMPLDVYGDISRDELLILIKSLNYGDGNKRKNPSWTVRTMEIATGNKQFADNIQSLCVTRGIRCNQSKRLDGAIILYVNPDRRLAVVRGCNETGRCTLKNAPVVDREPVWCVETKTGTIFVRREGRVAVVGNCREGIDIPSLYQCILATPIGSLASYIQSVGRVLRYSPATPDEVILSDHGGNYHRHGSPNDDRPWRDWWSMPESVVSELHTAEIRDGVRDEPICCPNCHGERKSGILCPHCGYASEKGKRRVIMETGEMREVDGKIVRPRRTARHPDTQEKWTRMYFGYKNKCLDKSFNELEAFFAHTHGYHPPRNLDYMPKATADWYVKVKDLEHYKMHNSKTEPLYAA